MNSTMMACRKLTNIYDTDDIKRAGCSGVSMTADDPESPMNPLHRLGQAQR